MEEKPKIRIVGKVTETEGKNIQEGASNILYENRRFLKDGAIEQLRTHEEEKTKEKISLVNFANIETSRLMKEAGVEPFDIPLENLYIISRRLYSKTDDKGQIAFAKPERYSAFFDRKFFEKNLLSFGSAAIHEILHLKSHTSKEANSGSLTLFRSGFSVYSSQKEIKDKRFHLHFSGLDEAIVSETERRLNSKLLELPELKKEREWLNSEKCKEMKAEIAKKNNIPEIDIIWCNKKGKFWTLGYRYQRKVFYYLCEEIQKQFSDKFKDKDDVYKLFRNTLFTGKLFEIAHFVEDTFGKGSFRVLGNMDDTKKSAILHMETLKKFRFEKLKSSEKKDKYILLKEGLLNKTISLEEAKDRLLGWDQFSPFREDSENNLKFLLDPDIIGYINQNPETKEYYNRFLSFTEFHVAQRLAMDNEPKAIDHFKKALEIAKTGDSWSAYIEGVLFYLEGKRIPEELIARVELPKNMLILEKLNAGLKKRGSPLYSVDYNS